MAREIRTFQVTTAPGVLPSAPLVTDLAMPPRIVKEIEVVIPRGCNGVLGFAFGAAGRNVIPYNPGAWVIGSGETLNWALEDQMDSGAWQLQSYNAGNYPHTLYIRFLLDYVTGPAPVPINPGATLSGFSTLTPAALASLSTPDAANGFGV